MDSIIKVHRTLGPGLLEKLYEECLIEELTSRGLECNQQRDIPVFYNNKKMRSVLRLDLLVEESVIVEIKSVEKILPVHKAQILSYMKIARKPLGLLVNFNVSLAKDGISRHIMREYSKDSGCSGILQNSGVITAG